MSPLSFATGNHHLFLILKTAIGEDWIVLLGKRKPNFPFAGTRFENATFYNVTQNKLHHLAGEELKSLEIKMDGNWMVTAKEPLPFSIVLHPAFLKTSRFFFKKMIHSASKHIPGAMFDHHLLSLLQGLTSPPPTANFQTLSRQFSLVHWTKFSCLDPPHASKARFFQQGEIEGEAIVSGHGFSEQGCLSILNLKSFEMPFHYNLFLEKEGDSGFLEWHVPPQKGLSPMVKLANVIRKCFLKEQSSWGSHPFNPALFKQEVLTATHIPLNHWTLRREIVKATGANKSVYYGLKESFVALKKV